MITRIKLLTLLLTIVFTAILPTQALADGNTVYASETFRVGSWGYVILGDYYHQLTGVVPATGTTLPSWVTIYYKAGFTTQLFINNPPATGTYTYDLVANNSTKIHVTISVTSFRQTRYLSWCTYANAKSINTIPNEFTTSTWTIADNPNWVQTTSYYGTITTSALPLGTYKFTAVETWPLGINDYVVTLYVKQPIYKYGKLLPCTAS
jgi:hypothetical protein